MDDASQRVRGERLILFRGSPRALPRNGFSAFARMLLEQVADGSRFQCLITNDGELQRLNRQFLGKDYPTDVLSFPEPGDGYLGELAISGDRAIEQAAAYGHSPAEEVKILMLHGLLHLLGYDHETDRGRMARAESQWRRHLGLPAGLIERARR